MSATAYPTNLALAALFDEISQLYEIHKDLDKNNSYRSRTYERAADQVRKYNRQINSGRQLKDEISGFGTSLAKDVDEYLQSGKITRLRDLRAIQKAGDGIQFARSDIPIPAYVQENLSVGPSKNAIIRLFQRIEGVGKVTAGKWYDAGARTIKDIGKLQDEGKIKLTTRQMAGYQKFVSIPSPKPEMEPSPRELAEKQRVLTLLQTLRGVGPATAKSWFELGIRNISDVGNYYNVGKITLTDAQKLGYVYYNDLIQPIPRAELDVVVKYINQQLDKYYIHLAAGSYRRGLPQSGDLDVLIQAREGGSLTDVINRIRDILVAHLSVGEHVYQGIYKASPQSPARRIDLKWIDGGCWPCATLHFTGPGKFNVLMRQAAIGRGLKLSEYGLVNKATGQYYDVKSEADVFAVLGLQYLTPEQRQTYA